MKINKILLLSLLTVILFISGCNSVSDFSSELFGSKPYISGLKADKEFYSSRDNKIEILLKIKNPTDLDYSPVKLGVNYPNGTTPVDWQLRDNELTELVSIKSKERKSYVIVFDIDEEEIINNTLQFRFRIYNFNNYKFDEDSIKIEFSKN